jgi:folylpolyglutamate synthase/dihydropteroate synthase
MRARGIAPTPVEIAFLATLQLRKNIGSHCCLVVEVGRGGATDYTNVFRGAIVGLTRIGHDHLDLFQDLAGVAREKVGLSSSGGLLVSVEQDPVIRCVIEQECRCREITIEWLSHSLVADLPAYLRAWQENRILGNRLAQLIVGPDWRLGRVERRDPWRIERRTIGSKGFILDGGHNPEAVQLLLDSLRVRQKSDWVGIFGLLTRKRYDEIAHIIGRSSLFKRLIVVQGSRGEFVDSHHLGFLVGIPYISASSMQNAIIECLRSDDASVAVFGSFRLAYDFERSLHALGLGETAIPINDIDPLVSSTEPLSFSCASLC